MADNLVFAAIFLLPAILAAALYLFFCRYRLNTGMNWRVMRLTSGNVLVLLFLCSLLLLGGEFYYRFIVDTTDAYAMSRTSKAWFGRHWQGNSMGFRDSAPLHFGPRPANQCRVTFLGDSFTAGHGVADVERRFANLVRRDRPQWQVDVVAVDGYDTGDELAEIDDLNRLAYELDVLVLVYNINDVADLMPMRHQLTVGVSRQPPFLFQHSFFLNTLWVRWNVIHDPILASYYGSLRRGYEEPLWHQQQERLLELQQRITASRGRLVVVTFPFLDQLGPSYPFRDIHAQLDAFWQMHNIANLDLLETMEAHRSESLVVNSHDPHPNERAHELAASAIEQFLDRELVKRK